MGRYRQTAREKLIDKLSALGYEVVSLEGVSGYWKAQDVYRWEAWCRVKVGQYSNEVHIGSYNTMTECANWNMTVDQQFDSGTYSPTRSRLEATAEKRKR